jgi:hypothetical protein
LSDNEKYTTFLPHIETYLGEAREFEPPTVTGRNRGYGLFFCYPANGKTISIVTNGLRFQNITAIMPQELVCTVWAEHRKAAHLLVPLTAELVLRRGTGVVYDDVIPSPQPLIPDTDIGGVIANTHPYAEGDDFDTVLSPAGQPEVQLITLIPATTNEIAYAMQHGVDQLYQIWEENETDLLDPHHRSAV